MVRGWQWWLLAGAVLLAACGTKTKETPHSTGQQPPGGEAGAPAAGGNHETDAAGQGGSPPGTDGGAAGDAGDAGDAGVGGPICDEACLANRPPVWIVYGANDVYGVRSDRLGKMEPVDLSPALSSDEEVSELGNWSPDGSAVVLITEAPVLDPKGGPDFVDCRAYLLRFADGSPTEPLEIAHGGSFGLADFTWSPSGKTLLFSHAGRLYAISPAATQSAPPTQISVEGRTAQRSWFKGDDEVVYLARDQASKIDAVLVVQQGDAWEAKSITHDLGIGGTSSLSDVVATSDLSQLYYPAVNKAGSLALWSVQTSENSEQHQRVSPAQDLAFRLSPDDEQYLLATSDAKSRKTSIFGGAISSLGDPVLLADNLELTARSSLGSVTGTWSNDSRHALAFEFDAGSIHPVLYQVGAVKPWQSLPITPADGHAVPTWSPDSKVLAIARVAGESTAPSLFTSAGRQQLDLDTASPTGGLDLMQFSPSGDFLVYADRSAPHESQSFHYLDIRRGLAAAEAPTAVQAEYFTPDFANDGTRLVYVNRDECFFLDLAKASAPTAVASGSAAYACSIQKLPQ